MALKDTAELCNLHRGQGMDLYWRETNTCPTEEEYLQMIDFSALSWDSVMTELAGPDEDRPLSSATILALLETGGLIRLAVKLMQAASSVKDLYVACRWAHKTGDRY